MAGVSTEQGSNKLDVELNLVPFIDLLSCLVLFLLVTAVWLQISAIQASVDSKGKSTVAQAEAKKLLIQVTGNGYHLTWPAHLSGKGLPQGINKSANGYEPEKITALLKKLGAGKLPMTAVGGDNEVPYNAVVQAIDAAKNAGVGSVALSTD